MDRHMYTQATADGMSELPVLLGRVQGPNMWGRAVQLANGGILGMTGRRRSSIDTYVPFFADHTLGTGVDPDMPSFAILDPKVYEQVIDFPNGYCTAPPEGPSCVIDRYYADPSYLPDGRALVAHNDAKTYVLHGEDMFLGHVQGDTEAARIESMRPFVPKHMGISAIDLHGKTERLLDPVPGTMLTSPVWVGKRWAPRKQPWKTDEAKKTADLHIASVPAWFSFALDTGAKNKNTPVGAIVALRVLVKDLQGNACLNDGRPYRYAVNDGSYDHPTHLGRNDATGFTKLVVPRSAGGDAYGDVPLEADGSVHLRLPAGKLLLFQGIDANGHAVVQRSRLLSLAPGQKIDTSVRAAQYEAHCMSCHGALDPKSTFVGLKDIEKIPFVPMDFDTLAAKKADASSAPTKRYTFKDTVRPLLDRACVSCHSGSAPAGGAEPRGDVLGGGELPGGQVGLRPRARGSGVHGLGARERARARIQLLGHLGVELPRGRSVVQGEPGYAGLIASHAPLAGLAPWHPT
jgi:mono/diheme cytochrome c family protein